MTKDPRVYLAHIAECIQKIERFTADGKNRFLSLERAGRDMKARISLAILAGAGESMVMLLPSP